MPDVKAIVRIRIPFKRPEEAVEGEDATPKQIDSKFDQAPLEEIEYEDKVLAVNTQGSDYNVLVVHQLA